MAIIIDDGNFDGAVKIMYVFLTALSRLQVAVRLSGVAVATTPEHSCPGFCPVSGTGGIPTS